VKVGEQSADQAELESWGDKDFCCAGVRRERTVGSLKRAVLQRSNDCCADRNDAPAFAYGAIDSSRGSLRQRVAFAVKMYILQSIHAQWSKCTQANMQRDVRNLNAPCGKFIQYVRRHVQSGRGRGHGAAFPRKDCLIALAIAGRIVAANIGRQGHVADAIEHRKKIADWLELKDALAEFAAIQHFRFKFNGPVSVVSLVAGKASLSPMPTFFPGLTRARHALSPAGSVSSTSIWPLGCWRSRTKVR